MSTCSYSVNGGSLSQEDAMLLLKFLSPFLGEATVTTVEQSSETVKDSRGRTLFSKESVRKPVEKPIKSSGTVEVPLDDSSLSGSYIFSPKLLKKFFSRAARQFPDLRRFEKYFKRDRNTGFHVLTQSNMNYPSFNYRHDDTRNLVCTFQFNDEVGSLTYITATFPKDGLFYYVPKVELLLIIDGYYQKIKIDVDDSFFGVAFPLTKEQVLSLFAGFLGDFALIRFLDFFVDIALEGAYDKKSVISNERILPFYDILPHKEEKIIRLVMKP
jgi:hypothetical protein